LILTKSPTFIDDLQMLRLETANLIEVSDQNIEQAVC